MNDMIQPPVMGGIVNKTLILAQIPSRSVIVYRSPVGISKSDI